MNLISYEAFKELFSAAQIDITPEKYEKFARYADILAEKNAVMNLTAITDPAEVAEKHFLDSVLPIFMIDFPKGAALIDVGAGAGFPSVPMAIERPDLRPTMLDSLNKRVTFLKELTSQLDIRCRCIHARAEEAGQAELREQFDVAVARAVSRLSVLCEYCLPLVKVGGFFAALKGSGCKEELDEAKTAIKTLGGRLEKAAEYTLPNGDGRTLVIIRKVSETPKKYPRQQGKIKAFPL